MSSPYPVGARGPKLLRRIHQTGETVVDMGDMLLGLGFLLFCLYILYLLFNVLIRVLVFLKDAVVSILYSASLAICQNRK